MVLPRLKGDLVDIFEACIDGTLDRQTIEWKEDAAVCVVLASGGYPLQYKKGYPISGLDAFSDREDLMIYHAGTAFNDKGEIVTNGGRVLGLTALAPTLDEAIAKAYANIDRISFQDCFYRHDIGQK